MSVFTATAGSTTVPMNSNRVVDIERGEIETTGLIIPQGNCAGRKVKCLGKSIVTLCLIAAVIAAIYGYKSVSSKENILKVNMDENNPFNSLGLGLASSGERLVTCVGVVGLAIIGSSFGVILGS